MPAVRKQKSARKDGRVHARLRPEDKDFLQATAVSAGLTLSAFMVSASLREAYRIRAEQTTKLTAEQATAFGEMLVNPPAPSKAAVASLKKARRWPRK